MKAPASGFHRNAEWLPDAPRLATKFLRSRRRGGFVSARQRLFQLIQHAVQIDRNQIHGPNTGQCLAVGKPAGTEIPAAFGCGAQIAVDLFLRTLRRIRSGNILAIGLFARRRGIVLIPIQYRAARQPYDATMRLSYAESFAAFHPEVVFLLQRCAISGISTGAFAGDL